MSRHLKVTIEVWVDTPDSDNDRILAHDVQHAVVEACCLNHSQGLDRLSCDRAMFTSSRGALVRVSHENIYRDDGVVVLGDLLF